MFPLPLLVGLILALLPTVACAHGTEFIMSRLNLLEKGSLVELRLVVDFLGNPMIADEAAAHEALQNALLIQHGGKTTRFSELAPLEFSLDGTLEEAMPASLLPPPDGQGHSLLTALWRWQPDSPEIAFTVAQGNKHDVLLWQHLADGEVKSVLLLGGDVSPAIPVIPTLTSSAPSRLGWVVLPLALLGGLLGLRQRYRHSQR